MSVGVTVTGLSLWPAVGLLILMEAGLPIPIPDDLVMLAVGARVAGGELEWWVGRLALEIVAVASTLLLFGAARGPGNAIVRRFGPRVGLTTERLDHATELIARRGSAALAIRRGTPGLRTVTAVAAGSAGLQARRGRRRGLFAWKEAACPACLGLAALAERFPAHEPLPPSNG